MKEISTIKTQISSNIKKYIDDIFNEISNVSGDIDILNKNILEKSEQFTDISNEYDRVFADTKTERQAIQHELADINTQRNVFVTDKAKMGREIISAEKTIKELLTYIDVLTNKKNTLEKETKTVDTLKVIKVNLEKEINELRLSFKEETNDYEQFIKLSNKTVKDLELDIDRLEKEHKVILDKVLPKIEDLNKREKQLDSRESGLSIIEKRYKKLYAEQGAGFKM